MKKSDLAAINKLRKEEGLPPIEPGMVKCLRCDAMFESWDKRNNRVCDECKNSDDYGEHAEAYPIPKEILTRLKTRDKYDKFLLEIEYGNRILSWDTSFDDLLVDTTLMDREDW